MYPNPKPLEKLRIVDGGLTFHMSPLVVSELHRRVGKLPGSYSSTVSVG